MDPCVNLPFDAKTLNDVVEKAKDFCLMHGICMRRKDAYDRDALHFAPFLLLPSPFPREEFKRAQELQTLLNELMHRVAHDNDFLEATLSKTIEVDGFTGRLFKIHQQILSEGGSAQKLSLGMLRSDIMLDTHHTDHTPFCCWKQVEINTIASGFGWMGPASGLIHSLGLFRSDYFFCCLHQGIKQVEFNTIASSFGAISSTLVQAQKYVLSELNRRDLLPQIPPNNALEGLAQGMLDAWEIYNSKKSVILFIIEDVTYNICDQKFHEFKIRELNPDVFVIRRTLTEIANEATLDEKKRLLVDGHEVAVVYFRCGYHPDQYPTEKEWDARLMIERSLAIKSPSIHYHLAGTKKVQQALANAGAIEKYFSDEAKIESIRGIFTGLYSIDADTKGNEAFEAALNNPERYVLKPQREGGGNNVYGHDIVDFLKSLKNDQERNAYILMDRISPPVTTNYLIRPGLPEPQLVKVVSELGIFGYIIGDENETKINKQVGHMLRTKLSHVNEGGVAAGLGALDSVILVDQCQCVMVPESTVTVAK